MTAVGLDALTLDQVRLFVCAAQEGSFSAAARRLGRAQSAVSYGVANLEKLLGVQLFDRSGHRPALTETGRGLLSDARQILDDVGKLHARASSVADGLEMDVRLAVDAICPAELLIELCTSFQEQFPTVSLHIHTDVLGAVAALVLEGTCQVGISGPVGLEAEELERRFLADIPMVAVAAAGHALSGLPSPISRGQLRGQVQIVITQRVRSPASMDYGVLSDTTWRVADAATKLALIRAGLGWGNLPLALVREDLERGALVQLVLEERGPRPLMAPLAAITRGDSPPGPAGRWLLGTLETLCLRCPELERAGAAAGAGNLALLGPGPPPS